MNNFWFLINMMVIWYIFFWAYRGYRLDRFRSNLFTLRDRLYDMAAAGEIEFTHPVYRHLRGMLNANIRHGHSFGLIEVISTAFLLRNSKVPEFVEEFERDLAALPGDLSKKVSAIRSEMHFCIAEQIVLTSAICWCTIVLMCAAVFMRRCHRFVSQRVRDITESFGERMDPSAILGQVTA